MIVSKTPLRMSYVGGGSDLEAFYRYSDGAVLSTAIDKFVYVMTKDRFENGVRVSYSQTENVSSVSQIDHPLVRNALLHEKIRQNIEIISAADIPSTGTGLGSSSSFSVGLLNCLSSARGLQTSASSLAERACHLEIELSGNPIGKQDQYAAAFGGLNLFQFSGDGSVKVFPVRCQEELITKLDQQTIVFYVGGSRDANSILAKQSRALQQSGNFEKTMAMVKLAWALKEEFESNSIEDFGSILNENWHIKRELSNGITNNEIDDIYAEALRCGSEGGKLLGAGGGGFMMFHAKTEHTRGALRSSFSKLKEVRFSPWSQGSEIVMNNGPFLKD